MCYDKDYVHVMLSCSVIPYVLILLGWIIILTLQSEVFKDSDMPLFYCLTWTHGLYSQLYFAEWTCPDVTMLGMGTLWATIRK